jgi:hypothetical protein
MISKIDFYGIGKIFRRSEGIFLAQPTEPDLGEDPEGTPSPPEEEAKRRGWWQFWK